MTMGKLTTAKAKSLSKPGMYRADTTLYLNIAPGGSNMLAAFRALRLNMGTDDTVQSTLLDAETWRRITGDVERSGRCVWGLDLGQSYAMSACAAYWPASGRLEALASFPNKPAWRYAGMAG